MFLLSPCPFWPQSIKKCPRPGRARCKRPPDLALSVSSDKPRFTLLARCLLFSSLSRVKLLSSTHKRRPVIWLSSISEYNYISRSRAFLGANHHVSCETDQLTNGKLHCCEAVSEPTADSQFHFSKEAEEKGIAFEKRGPTRRGEGGAGGRGVSWTISGHLSAADDAADAADDADDDADDATATAAIVVVATAATTGVVATAAAATSENNSRGEGGQRERERNRKYICSLLRICSFFSHIHTRMGVSCYFFFFFFGS